MLRFEIPCAPIGKGRPRVTHTGHAYTPERTRIYEDVIRVYAKQAMIAARAELMAEPICVELIFYLPDHRNEPDLDNLVKTVLDACNGIVYTDDRQVVRLRAEKLFDKAHPRTGIVIMSTNEDAALRYPARCHEPSVMPKPEAAKWMTVSTSQTSAV